MKKVFLTVVLLCGVGGLFAGEVKTQEQSKNETIAFMDGSQIRHMGGDKAQCNKKYKSAEATKCIEGYEKTDANLKQPVK
ncbi:MAG TPA: hypothetical protein PKW30_06685 [Campylobacterales bacterium]|nr:hypothetical protein [Campylobacterales bacterium]